MNFDGWLASILGQNEQEARVLLRDATALQFLIAWSLFESKCFGGFVKIPDIQPFCRRIVAHEGFATEEIEDAARYFHLRYQNPDLYRHLMHKQVVPQMLETLQRPFNDAPAEDKAFIVATTAYRYRNNMFHGNKGVHDWLHFREQIRLCTSVLQAFVTHAERRLPTLRILEAA